MGGLANAVIPSVQSILWSEAKALGIPAGNENSDDRLIADLAAGDHRAFSRLVTRHGDRLRAVALRFTGNESDTEEILQETFWRAWRKSKNWKEDGSAQFSTWLYRTLVNQCIDFDRKRRVRSWFSLPGTALAPDDLIDDGPDPEMAATARELLGLVRSDILKLPARQRVVLLLSVLEGHSNGDIAAILDISVGAVEQALVRARRKLREDMRTRSELDVGTGRTQ
ncbi:MAG: sigma-70 family RNA polymerase sigma factor [Fimbriimonadaceae bacterium]|nr:sigma-70 family RNA polymerase sigma factor [Alphaproteobacteria bacterium]